jgi:hypothetical protein
LTANEAVVDEKMQFPEKIASSDEGPESEKTQSVSVNFSAADFA